MGTGDRKESRGRGGGIKRDGGVKHRSRALTERLGPQDLDSVYHMGSLSHPDLPGSDPSAWSSCSLVKGSFTELHIGGHHLVCI